MNDLYFEINPKQNVILSPPKELDINWKNISGIIFLSKDELYDLTWAGYPETGFLQVSRENISRIKNLKYDDNILSITKSKYKNIVSYNRYEKELQTLLIDDKFSIQLTDKCKLHILMKYNECLSNKSLKFNWEKFLKLYQKIQEYIQNLFDAEITLHKKIEECETIESILETDLSINCNNKIKL